MNNTLLLRISLRVNAVFSATSGVLALGFAERIAELISMPRWILVATGVVLLLYGLGLTALSYRTRVASPLMVVATLLDLGWVVGSAALLAIHPMQSTVPILVPTIVVFVFAVLQLEGLRRAVFAHGTGRWALERTVHASTDRTWDIVSDVARFADVASNLHRTEVVSGSGVGMVRRCEANDGVCWSETCTRWEPGRAYAFEVDTAAGYPLPLKTMRGDFEVDAIDTANSLIRFQFTFTLRGGRFAEMSLAVLFALRGDALVGDILERWASRIESLENRSGVELAAAVRA
jgi:Polyketide cyclase / dehydrase and lipid transport